MPVTEIITKEVDALIELVRKRKHISAEEAAMILGIDVHLVSQWALFLEETGMISSVYRSGRHYLVEKRRQSARPKQLNMPLPFENTAHQETIFQKGGAKHIFRIKKLLGHMRSLVSHLKFSSAGSVFSEIIGLYNTIPDTDIEQKARLHEQILTEYGHFAERKRKFFAFKFEHIGKKISGLTEQAYAAIEHGSAGRADALFSGIKALQQKLPGGFAEKRLILGEEIIELHEELMELKLGYAERDVHAVSQKISSMLDGIKKNIADRRIDAAISAFNEVRILYTGLPNGFLEEKQGLLELIASIDRELIALRLNELHAAFRKDTEKIKKLADIAERYLKKNNHELAHAIYEEASTIFAGLPLIRKDDRLKLKNRLLALYNATVAAFDSSISSSGRYRQLLGLLVVFHRHVFLGEFSLAVIDCKYMAIHAGQFPKNLRISKEVYSAIEAIRIYQKIAGRKKGISGADRSAVRQLARKNITDSALFSYLESQLSAGNAEMKNKQADNKDALQKKTGKRLAQIKKESVKERNNLMREIEKARAAEAAEHVQRASILREQSSLKKRIMLLKEEQRKVHRLEAEEARLLEHERVKLERDIGRLRQHEAVTQEEKKEAGSMRKLRSDVEILEHKKEKLTRQQQKEQKAMKHLQEKKQQEEKKLKRIAPLLQKITAMISAEQQRLSGIRQQSLREKISKKLRKLKDRRLALELEERSLLHKIGMTRSRIGYSAETKIERPVPRHDSRLEKIGHQIDEKLRSIGTEPSFHVSPKRAVL